MSNPAIVKITKQEVVTEYQNKDGQWVIIVRNEGVCEKGKSYSWITSNTYLAGGIFVSGFGRNYKEIIS